MSIRDEIRIRVYEGRLFFVYPRFHFIGAKRALYVTKDVWDKLDGCWEEGGDKRLGKLYADLEFFVGGGILGSSYITFLSPAKEGVFQIRSTYPYPQLRLIGCFAEQDNFIGTQIWDRDELGRFGSKEWKKAFEDCKKIWGEILPNHEPMKGTVDIHDYATDAAP